VVLGSDVGVRVAAGSGAVTHHMTLSHPGRVDRLVLASISFGGLALPGCPSALLQMMHPRGHHRDRLAGLRMPARREDEDRAGTGRGPEDVRAG
jgi:pimeloyl-ACP methyl ester carboxylesterase